MKKILASAAVLAAFSSVAPAHADNWTGWYVGAAVARHDAKLKYLGESEKGHDSGPTVFVGYQQLTNNGYVLGAELSYEKTSDVKMTRTRFKAGYDAGAALPYLTVGLANVDAGSLEGLSLEKTGLNVGVGVDYAFTNNFFVGAEYSFTKLKNVVLDDINIDVNSIQLRAAYKF